MTPRSIILFINQLAAFYQQSLLGQPLHYYAVYLLFEKDITNSIRRYQVLQLQDEQLERKLSGFFLSDEDWKAKLFALHFNIQPEKAFIIVMSGFIQKYICSGQCKPIMSFANSPGFLDTLELIVSDSSYRWRQGDTPEFGLMVFALDKLEQKDTLRLKKLYDQLYLIASQSTNLNQLEGNCIKGLLTLVRKYESNTKSPVLANKLVETLFSIKSLNGTFVSCPAFQMAISQWADFVFRVISYLRPLHLSLIKEKCFLVLPPKEYVALLVNLLKNPDKSKYYDEELLWYLRPSNVIDVNHICLYAINDQSPNDYKILLKTLSHIAEMPGCDSEKWQFEKAFQILKEKISHVSTEPILILKILQAMLDLSAMLDEHGITFLVDFTKSQQFFNLFNLIQNLPEAKELVRTFISRYNPAIEMVHSDIPQVRDRSGEGHRKIKDWIHEN